MNIVEIKGLQKSYGKKLALNNVCISIKEGNIYGLLGPNGAGKSTIIKIISGLINYDDGSCTILNKDIKNNKKFIQKNIGVVTQENSIYNDLKAKENIEFFARISGVNKKNLEGYVKEALRLVNLENNAYEYPSGFSGGMRKRLNIACALVHKPKLLIMDEPTASLDPVSRQSILNTVSLINKNGATIIYTSHHLNEVEEICNNVSILNKGQVIAEGKIEELISIINNKDVINLKILNTEDNILKKLNDLKRVLIINSNIQIINNHKSIVNFRKDENRELLIQINCENSAVILQRLLPYLKENNIYVKELSVSKNSLEEIFFSLLDKDN